MKIDFGKQIYRNQLVEDYLFWYCLNETTHRIPTFYRDRLIWDRVTRDIIRNVKNRYKKIRDNIVILNNEDKIEFNFTVRKSDGNSAQKKKGN